MNGSTIIGILFIVIVGSFVWWQNSTEITGESLPVIVEDTATLTPVLNNAEAGRDASESDDITAVGESNGSVAGPVPASTGVTAAVVAQHATRTSCWSIVNGNVYDLTSWIPKHPGGEQAILQICGVDGSAKFNRKHGGDAAKEKILFGFKVAALSQ